MIHFNCALKGYINIAQLISRKTRNKFVFEKPSSGTLDISTLRHSVRGLSIPLTARKGIFIINILDGVELWQCLSGRIIYSFLYLCLFIMFVVRTKSDYGFGFLLFVFYGVINSVSRFVR